MNLGELRTQLQAHGYETDTATAQTAMLNSVYRRLAGERHWDWLRRVNTTLVLATGFNVIDPRTIGSSVLGFVRQVTFVRLAEGSVWPAILTGTFYDLEFKPEEEFWNIEHVNVGTQGTPLYYTVSGQLVYFWPTADKAYTAGLEYILDPPDLGAVAGDADVPLFPDTYHDILVYGAIRLIAARERDWNASNWASQEYEARKADMRRQQGMKTRHSSVRVQQSGIFGNTLLD